MVHRGLGEEVCLEDWCPLLYVVDGVGEGGLGDGYGMMGSEGSVRAVVFWDTCLYQFVLH